jgi:Tfp pilus assembly protein PilF/glutathione synthase/RimK-type ligase-like ATP-grasp enzyme
MKTKEYINPGIADQLNTATALLGSGNIARAERILGEILAKNRNNSEALGLLATAYFLRGEKKLSKNLWKRSLENKTQPLIFLANLHAFLHALLIENNRTAAVKQAARRLPEWPATQRPDSSEREMLIELADMLAELDQPASACRLLESVSKALPADIKLTATLGLMQMLQGDYATALETLSAVDRDIQPKTDLSLLARMYQCADILEDEGLTTSLLHRAVAAYPVYVAPRLSGQAKNILVIKKTATLDKTITSERDLFLYSNYPSQLSKKLAGEFHFSAIFSDIEDSRNARSSLPDPDLIINDNVNAENIIEAGNLPMLADFVDGFGVSVVNHPRQAISTTREHTAKLINDIPGLIVPGTVLFSKDQQSNADLIDAIEANFDYPLITRTLCAQEGKGMLKIDNRESLAKALIDIPEEFYVTKFIDSRDESGFYRKIRAAIIDNEIYIVRVDYDTHWNVHGRKSDERVKFYQDHPQLLVTEERICSNPVIELGPSIMQSLDAIRERIPLDIFGVDFDISRDGKIIFYEANASMNLLSSAHPDVDHPVCAEERLLSAFRRFLHGLIDN